MENSSVILLCSDPRCHSAITEVWYDLTHLLSSVGSC